jgi:hypothetical protein
MSQHHNDHPGDHMDREIRHVLDEILHRVRAIERELRPHHPTHITFGEITMNPTAANSTQVFTGTLTPAGSVLPADSAFGITSNDPAVSPSVDATGLVVSVTYPDGWVESTTTPLTFGYTASSASAGMSLSATITPSAPPAPVPTGISFAQTS